MANDIRVTSRFMNKENQDAARSVDKFLVLPVFLALTLTITTLIIPDLAHHFVRDNIFAFKNDFDLRTFDLAFFLTGIAILIFQTIMLFFAARRRRLKAMLSYTLSVGVVILSLLSFGTIIEELQIAKTHIFPGHFSTCSQASAKYSDTGSLKVCSTRTHGNSILTIIFDSGSEVARPAPEQSAAFKNFIRDEIGPLLSQCEVYVRGLSNHFFLVRSDCG